MNKKLSYFIGGTLCLVLIISCFVFLGCGQGSRNDQNNDPGGPGGGDQTQTNVPVTSLFNVSNAVAVSSAKRSTSTGGASALDASTQADDIVKITGSGSIESIFNTGVHNSWRPPVTVIERGPDGWLYIGFANKLYYYDPNNTTGTPTGTASTSTTVALTTTTMVGSGVRSAGGGFSSGAAFFRIKLETDGSTSIEVVDSAIDGMGSWYSGSSNNGELPAKQIQFDTAGNVYYLGQSYTSGAGTVLKKKSTAGVISQIGSSMMQVRDFLVCPNGFVFYHGSDSGNWSIEWLRVYYGSSGHYIFYNGGSTGWLRAYYRDKDNNVMLVGSNLTLLDDSSNEKRYSGIIRVNLDSSGQQTSVTALYDDNNMYDNTGTYNTIGNQLTWGYWEPGEMTQKKFFETTDSNQPRLPLELKSGVTEASIRSYIRNKFQSISVDDLDSLTFAGQTTDTAWALNTYLDNLVAAHITGTTWADWRTANGLSGIAFGNAKQLVFADDGSLYAVMPLDNWGSTTTKGDKLFRIVDSTGTATITAYAQHSTYKNMSKARACGDYVVYLSSKVGVYKILRSDLINPSASPTDLRPTLGENATIYGFSYSATGNLLIYNYYNGDNNISYYCEQPVDSVTPSVERETTGFTLSGDLLHF